MRSLVAVQFESIADEAMLSSERRHAVRRVISTCLEEWAVPPQVFRGGEEALEHALREHRIQAGPSTFPYIENMSWTASDPRAIDD